MKQKLKKLTVFLLTFSMTLNMLCIHVWANEIALTEENSTIIEETNTIGVDYECFTGEEQPENCMQTEVLEDAECAPEIVSAALHTQDEAISWVKSKVGCSLDMDGAYGAQCVDLILAYYDYLGVPRVSGNGVDYAYNALPNGWKRIQGGSPQKGDILIFGSTSSNPYGHVAIYESDYSVYHQNYNWHSYVENVTHVPYYTFPNPYWGLIRPDFASPESGPTEKKTINDVRLISSSYTYNGKAFTPEVIVMSGSTTLKKGVDYNVSYTDNINAGTATVTVTGKDAYSGTIKKNFTISKANQSFSAKPVSGNIKVGENIQITAIGQGSVTYSSSNTSVASVSSSGIVTGKSVGTATITITAAGNRNYNSAKEMVSVTVNANYRANTIKASNFTGKASNKAQSFYIGAKANGGAKLSYKSDNRSVTVNSSSGKVTISKNFVGKATITISAAATSVYSAATRKITVTVYPSGTSISSIKIKGQKAMVKWQRNTICSGYQLQCSTDKNFKTGVKTKNINKNSTTSITISNLNVGKTYYIRIRTVKNGYYSGWSSSKIIRASGTNKINSKEEAQKYLIAYLNKKYPDGNRPLTAYSQMESVNGTKGYLFRCYLNSMPTHITTIGWIVVLPDGRLYDWLLNKYL